MKLLLKNYEEGIRHYDDLTASRGSCVRSSEDEFPEFPEIYKKNTPPHFTRADIQRIISWKHNMDARRRVNALAGLAEVPESRIVELTSNIGESIVASIKPFFCTARFAGEISGVGIATTSAILTAARPDLFAVIDTYTLAAIYHHYNFPWLYKLSRDKDRKLIADWTSYPPYVSFCRAEAAKLRIVNKSLSFWTPRKIDMALWGIGKKLESNGLL